MSLLKRLFTNPFKKSQLEEKIIQDVSDKLIAYISIGLNDEGDIDLDMDFVDGAEDLFSQLFFGINSGSFTEIMCKYLKNVCINTGRESDYLSIIEKMNLMLKDRADQLRDYISRDNDLPVVDPCNVFRQNQQQVGEVK